ncbi:MAG: hypothetical protein P0S94_01855, partial [Simkaniaceae bacterium]|nr:hypothetical protein [Simkaniaceae bacterium]
MSAINFVDHIVSQPAFAIGHAALSAQLAINSVANIARIALDTITFCQFPALYTNKYKSRILLSSLALIPMRLLNNKAYTVEPSDLEERFFVKVKSNFLSNNQANPWLNSGRHLARAPVILIAAIADVAAGALGFIAATCTLYQVESINKFTFVHLEG